MSGNILGGVLGDPGFIPVAGNIWFDGDVGIGIIPRSRLDVYENQNGTTQLILENDNAGNNASAQISLVGDTAGGLIGIFGSSYAGIPTLAGNLAMGTLDGNDIVFFTADLGSGAGDIRFSNGAVDILALMNSDSSGFIGVHTVAPDSIMHILHASPYMTLQNSASEDSDGGRESRLQVKGLQSGGEKSTLGYLEFSHDGAADDEKGNFKVMLNDGDDSDTPSVVGIEIDSTGEIVSHNQKAEMYIYENETETSITAVDQWHPAIGFIAGSLTGWTHEAGSSIGILSFADYSGTVAGTIKATTDGAHGFTTGDPIGIVGPNVATGGANEYYGQYLVTVVDADEFYFTNANWNATTTATAILPAKLIVGAGSDGAYSFNAHASTAAVARSIVLDFGLFKNASAITKAESRYQTKTAEEFDSLAGTCLVDVVESDILYFAVENYTDDSNFIVRYGNVNFTRC